ncbi:MAG: DNA polymerase I, partial [Rhodospirillales bacterium]|nr:DNA polymerase I [Rhodospirillales bacterium]
MPSGSESKPLKHLFLIDGSGFIFRAFHALPPMNRADGTPTNAVFGFCNMLMKLIDDTDADHIAVIFDAARRTFRNDIYPEYKAHRPPAPDELIPQFELVREAVRAFNVACVDMENYEADDLIATYARQAAALGAEVTIVSSDKDLMQLVGGGITMMDAMKNRMIGPDQVVEKFGVPPEKVVDVQSLAGDSSDNVPGVPGIGVKTAAELINQYGDLENLLAHAEEIKQPKRRERLIEFAESARISRELVRLRDDVPIDRTLDTFSVNQPDSGVLIAFLEEQGFQRIIPKVRGRFGGAATGRAAPAAPDSGRAPAPTTPDNALAEKPPGEKVEYELVQDVAALTRWIAMATAAGVVAVDTETNSLDAIRADLVGVSLSIEPGRACYIPLAHKVAAAQGAFDLGDGG